VENVQRMHGQEHTHLASAAAFIRMYAETWQPAVIQGIPVRTA